MEKEIKKKLTLTGSLQNLAKEAQIKNKMTNPTIINGRREDKRESLNNWEEVIQIAKEFKDGSDKIVATYISESLKKDLEMIKTLDIFKNVSLSNFLSAIVECYLRNNTNIIKDLMKKQSSRF